MCIVVLYQTYVAHSLHQTLSLTHPATYPNAKPLTHPTIHPHTHPPKHLLIHTEYLHGRSSPISRGRDLNKSLSQPSGGREWKTSTSPDSVSSRSGGGGGGGGGDVDDDQRDRRRFCKTSSPLPVNSLPAPPRPLPVSTKHSSVLPRTSRDTMAVVNELQVSPSLHPSHSLSLALACSSI